MQAPENTNAERQHTTGSNEKVILIETCRECKAHRSSTWHDETKYESNFKLVQAAINALTPEVEVVRKMDGPITLGAFEIKHGEQIIFSKKNTGLWPNAKAVAQRVKSYFEDLNAGKNVSNYGKQKEIAYVPKRVPAEARASTSAGFRSKLGASTNTQASAKNLTPSKPVKADSAGGSPGEEELQGDREDKVKGNDEEEHHHHHHSEEHRSKTPEHHAEGSDRGEAHPVGAAAHHEEEKEEHKPESGHETPKEKHESPAPVHENKEKIQAVAPEEHKEPGSAAHPKEEAKGSEPNSAVKSSEPESAAKGSEPNSAALGSEPHSAALGSEPHSAVKGSEPNSAAKGSEPNSATKPEEGSTPKEKKGEDKDKTKADEYPEDFS